jgi:hypothetical protein
VPNESNPLFSRIICESHKSGSHEAHQYLLYNITVWGYVYSGAKEHSTVLVHHTLFIGQ